MSNYNREEKLRFYDQRKLNTTNVWLLFILLGWSYGHMGQMGKQVLFYLTLGGLGIWTIYVLFTLSKKINNYNSNIAKEVGLEYSDIEMLGLTFKEQKNTSFEQTLAILLVSVILIGFILLINILLR